VKAQLLEADMLTREQVQELLEYSPDTGGFTWKVNRGRTAKAGQRAGCPDRQGYICMKILGGTYKAHRVAWLMVYGRWPDSQIDHINGVPGDNRISNLREVNPRQNAENRRVTHNQTSGVKGVTYMRKIRKWKAQVYTKGTNYYLGVFSTIEEAEAAYKAAALVLHTHTNLRETP
jgi:hypothetical protein